MNFRGCLNEFVQSSYIDTKLVQESFLKNLGLILVNIFLDKIAVEKILFFNLVAIAECKFYARWRHSYHILAEPRTYSTNAENKALIYWHLFSLEFFFVTSK